MADFQGTLELVNITNPWETVISFVKLSISRYLKIDLIGETMDNIFNYLSLSDRIATGGQPTKQQLVSIKNNGYQVVINLALPTSENALPNEKQSVEYLGMEYINIPIEFDNPQVEEFEDFCQVMTEHQTQKIFIHCAANLRVSAFMYLYRQIHEGISQEVAKVDLEKLWKPNPTWQKLIDAII